MPTFIVTDPSTGKKVKLTGDSPPTDSELEEIFASLPEPKVDPMSVPAQPPPEPTKPGVVESGMRGFGETLGVPSFKDAMAMARNAARHPIDTAVSAYEAVVPNPIKLADRALSAIGDRYAERFLADEPPPSMGEIGRELIDQSPLAPVAATAEHTGTAIGSGDPSDIARAGGNVAGIAAQILLAKKAPALAENLGAAGVAAGELPGIKTLVGAGERVAGRFARAKLEARAGRFNRKFGADVAEARREKLIDRPARDAEAAAADKSAADDMKRIVEEQQALEKAQAQERAQRKADEATALNRDISYADALRRAQFEEKQARLAKSAAEETSVDKSTVKLADQIAREQGKEAAAAARQSERPLQERVKLADAISRAQAEEVMRKGKPAPQPGPQPPTQPQPRTGPYNEAELADMMDPGYGTTSRARPGSGSLYPAGYEPGGPGRMKPPPSDPGAALAESLAADRPPAAPSAAPPDLLARLDAPLSKIPTLSGAKTPTSQAYGRARRHLESARRLVEAGARRGLPASDLEQITQSGLTKALTELQSLVQ